MRVHLSAAAGIFALGLGSLARAADPVLPLPSEGAAEITRFLGPGVVGQALPSQPIADASLYFPLAETAAVFHVTSGSNAGKQQTLRTTKGQRPGTTPGASSSLRRWPASSTRGPGASS